MYTACLKVSALAGSDKGMLTALRRTLLGKAPLIGHSRMRGLKHPSKTRIIAFKKSLITVKQSKRNKCLPWRVQLPKQPTYESDS